MRPTLLLVVASLIVACDGGDSIHSRNAAALEQKIADLSRRVEELDKQVKEVKELAEMPQHERMMREHQKMSQRYTKGADTEALAKIKLPDNATKDQVRQYVRAILAASAAQNSSQPNDPQVEMLTKVGPQHLDVLLEFTGTKGGVRGMGQHYVTVAIDKLATADHKWLVIAQLAAHPELMSLVERFGWQDDARVAILQVLGDGKSPVPYQIIPIIAKMKDPKTYPALTEQLAISDSPATIYAAIKDLPGIDLDEPVCRAWQRIQNSSNDHTKSTFVTTAIAHGDKDALGAFIELMDVTDTFELHRRGWAFLDRSVSPRRTVLKYIDFHGSDAEVQVWFEKNYHNLKFDKAKKVFVVDQPAAAQ